MALEGGGGVWWPLSQPGTREEPELALAAVCTGPHASILSLALILLASAPDFSMGEPRPSPGLQGTQCGGAVVKARAPATGDLHTDTEIRAGLGFATLLLP